MQRWANSGRGNTGGLWPTQTIRKVYNKYTTILLMNSLTISSPSEYLRWNQPNTDIPNSSFNFLVSPPTVGRISRLLGFNESRRYILLRLFDLAYSFRLRLPILVSVGYCLCHFFSIYFPRIEINVELEEEDDDEEIEIEEEPSRQSERSEARSSSEIAEDRRRIQELESSELISFDLQEEVIENVSAIIDDSEVES